MSNELVIVSWGGIGDAIVCTPTIKALKEKHPDKKIIIYYPRHSHKDVFLHNPSIDIIKPIKLKSVLSRPSHFFAFLYWHYPFHNLVKYLQRWAVPFTPLGFQHVPLSWAYNKSVKDIIPEIFGMKLTDNKTELFITEEEEKAAKEKLKMYKNVVFMHITSKSSPHHHWELNKWTELVRNLPEFTFIQFGGVDEPHVSGTIDWRGKTTLREAFALLKCSTSFIGIDSSFAHATNAFNLPGVVLWGDSSPVLWGHSNNLNVYKNMHCSPCYYDLRERKCPYNDKCMKSITVEEVQEALTNQVNKANKIRGY
jgi:ADP-heptose:LPS heptosyltransferase